MPRSWWYLITQFWGDQVHPATPFCVSSFLRKINSLQQWIIKSDLGHPPRQEVRKASNNLPLDIKCAKDTQDREVFARNEDFYPRPEDPASRGGPRYTHRVDLYSIQVSLVERNKSPSDLERVLWDKTDSCILIHLDCWSNTFYAEHTKWISWRNPLWERGNGNLPHNRRRPCVIISWKELHCFRWPVLYFFFFCSFSLPLTHPQGTSKKRCASVTRRMR